MLRIGIFLISLLILSLHAVGQTTPPHCPTISVTGPDGPTDPRKPYEFRVEVSGGLPKGVEFRWLASTGVILDGQGTNKIRIQRTDPEGGDNVTATVELIGLPKTCNNTASETAPPLDVSHILADEFSTLAPKLEKQRFEAAVVEYQKNRYNYLFYVIRYFKNGTPKSVIQNEVRRISEMLSQDLKLGTDKFEIDVEIGPGPRTKIYWAHPWISRPAP